MNGVGVLKAYYLLSIFLIVCLLDWFFKHFTFLSLGAELTGRWWATGLDGERVSQAVNGIAAKPGREEGVRGESLFNFQGNSRSKCKTVTQWFLAGKFWWSFWTWWVRVPCKQRVLCKFLSPYDAKYKRVILKRGLWNQITWVHIPAYVLDTTVSSSHSTPVYFRVGFWGLNEWICRKYIEEYLVHREGSVNVNYYPSILSSL